MELASKFKWRSVLDYDNAFKQLQAFYVVHWVHESHHLHSVKLEPLYSMPVVTNFTRKKSNAAPHLGFNGNDFNRKVSNYAMFSADGKEIC